MKQVDLHVHTLASACGLHSLLEVLNLAQAGGMKVIAITDHDLGKGTRIRVMSYRFPKVWQGMNVLAGIEFSILDGGKLRIPPKIVISDLDICLAGFHLSSRTVKDDPQTATDDLEQLLLNYPFVDIISHPTIVHFELQHDRAARLAAEHGVALEINNSSLRYGKEHRERLLSLLARCREHNTLIAVNSDAHSAPELGQDELSAQLLQDAGIDPQRVVTRTPKSALAFVESRRKNKLN